MSDKKWHDANEIFHVADVPEELRTLELEMKKKPNFDHFPFIDKNKKVKKEGEADEYSRTDTRPG